MSKAKRTKSPNADLVEAARSHRDQILMFHDQRGGTQPVILLDFQRLRLRSYPFKEYKATVRRNRRRCWTRNTRRPLRRTKSLSSCGIARPGGLRRSSFVASDAGALGGCRAGLGLADCGVGDDSTLSRFPPGAQP